MANSDSSQASPDPRRRRFLGAGAAATPAILTLISQPALGNTCFTPSRSLSKNTSASQAGKDGLCVGAKSPVFFRDAPDANWPGSVPSGTPFHPTFSGSNFIVSGTSLTMREVLVEYPTSLAAHPGKERKVKGKEVMAVDPTSLAAYVLSAYLNILLGYVPANVLTTAVVQSIWTQWSTVGYYTVTAGVNWTDAQIKDYLQSNGIVA